MRSALAESGWQNYSLFLGPGGLLVGYLECDDFAAAVAAMSDREVNTRWQALMSPFFVGIDQRGADQAMVALPEIFHLD
jgi:L-rhamnose mutarotase